MRLDTGKADVNGRHYGGRHGVVVSSLLGASKVNFDHEDENGHYALSRTLLPGYDDVVEQLRRYNDVDSHGVRQNRQLRSGIPLSNLTLQ
jgi:ankyrin repeat protein